MKKEYGGANGRIDYSDFGDKKIIGDRSGKSATRGNSSKTEGLGTTDTGDTPDMCVKDTKFRSVADGSGWGRS